MFSKATQLAILLATAFGFQVEAQTPAYVVHAVVLDGDTIPLLYLGEAEVTGRWTPKDRREAERYSKLMRQVVKVYPYAKITGQLLAEYEAELKAIGARVEERPISIFGADSRRDAERVLCSPRPELALHMAYSGLALANPKPCDTSGLDANEAFARAHGFGGTPVIVRPADGAVLEGFRPAAVLREFLRPTSTRAPTPAPKG